MWMRWYSKLIAQDATLRASLSHNFARAHTLARRRVQLAIAQAKAKGKNIVQSKGRIRVLRGTAAKAKAPASKAPAPAPKSPPSYVWDSVRTAGTAFAYQNIRAHAAKAADRAKARAKARGKAKAALMLLDL